MTVTFLPRPSHTNTFRHIEPKWTCSRAQFTLVANRAANAFAVHWTGRVQITTVPNQTEPGPVKITPLISQDLSPHTAQTLT